MLQGVQVHITLDIEFDVLAEILDISRDECIVLWDNGDLEEVLNDNVEIRVLAYGEDVSAAVAVSDVIKMWSAYF